MDKDPADQIAQQHIDAMPTPNESVIEHAAAQEQGPPATAGPVPPENPWSGAIAKPKTPPNAKKGRPKKAAAKSPAAPDPVPPAEPDPVATDPAQASATAMVVATMFFSAAQALGGEDFAPSEDERHQVFKAWEAYFLATGAVQLPAWAVPIIATSAYVMPRLSRPAVQERIAKFIRWSNGIPDPPPPMNPPPDGMPSHPAGGPYPFTNPN